MKSILRPTVSLWLALAAAALAQGPYLRLQNNPPSASTPAGFLDVYFSNGTPSWRAPSGTVKTAASTADLASGLATKPTLTDGKISSSVLPDSITIGSVVLADGSALALPSGSISGGSDGLIHIHNGVDNGGIPYAPAARNNLVTVKNWNTARMQYPVANTAGIGSITSAGNLNVVATGTKLAATQTLAVAVSLNDTPQVWIPKVVTALNANSEFNADYIAYAIGNLLQCQAKASGSDDLGISIDTGTAAGVTTKTSGTSVQYAYLELGRFTIPASEAAVGSQYYLSGSLNINTTGTTAGAARVGLSPSISVSGSFVSVSTNWSSVILTKTSGNTFSERLTLNQPFKFITSGGGYKLAGAPADTGLTGLSDELIFVTTNAPEKIATITFNTPSSPVAASLTTPTELILFAAIQLDSSMTACYAATNLTLVKSSW